MKELVKKYEKESGGVALYSDADGNIYYTDEYVEWLVNLVVTRQKPKFSLRTLICHFFGHKWKYNFSTIPNKAICTRCKCKSSLNLETLDWDNVKAFDKEFRTDRELIRDWV